MAQPTRICLLRRSDGQVAELDLSKDDELQWLKADDDQLVWLDLADPDASDVALLRERLGLHELAAEDLEKRHQRPKIDTYPGQHVIVAYEAVGVRSPSRRLWAERGAPDRWKWLPGERALAAHHPRWRRFADAGS